jgi:molybdate transport system substrate-binding protein
MKRRTLLTLVLMVVLALPATSHALTIASGAGYKKLVVDLVKAFEATSKIKPELVFGNMGQVTAQAKGSGVVDIVLGEKGFLDKAGLTFDPFVEIGRGVLVVAWPKGKTLASPLDLGKPSVKRVAMPDPKKAIYGRAGSQFLESAGLNAAVKDKLFVVATVPQVTTYVLSGEVDAGLTNRTDVRNLGDKIGGFMEVDQKYYKPIVIGAGVLTGAKNAADAKAFATFLGTDAAKAVAKQHGM